MPLLRRTTSSVWFPRQAGPFRRPRTPSRDPAALGAPRGDRTARVRQFSYLAGTDDDRLSDLTDALVDPTVRAIFATRGGKGSYRIVHLLPFAEIVRDPKPVIGFSDITHCTSPSGAMRVRRRAWLFDRRCRGPLERDRRRGVARRPHGGWSRHRGGGSNAAIRRPDDIRPSEGAARRRQPRHDRDGGGMGASASSRCDPADRIRWLGHRPVRSHADHATRAGHLDGLPASSSAT